MPDAVAVIPPSPPRIHVAHLDGLRALALLWVMFGHMIFLETGNILPHFRGVIAMATLWLYYVHFAVDVFIVLSGYCLVIPVMRSGALSGGALTFFKKRARRILPPFYAGLILSIILDLLGHSLPSFSWKTFAVNTLLLQDLANARNNINVVFWSIALEWRIYFLFPAIIVMLQHFGRKTTLLVTAVAGYGIALGCHALHVLRDQQFFCPWYLFLFTLGVCAGSVVHDRQRPPTPEALRKSLALSAAVTGLPLAFLLWAYPIGNGHMAFVHRGPSWTPSWADSRPRSSSGSAWTAGGSARTGRRASWRGALVLLGSFSYSAYLIHLPLISLILAAALSATPLGAARIASGSVLDRYPPCPGSLVFVLFGLRAPLPEHAPTGDAGRDRARCGFLPGPVSQEG